MKKIYILTLASLFCAATNVQAEESTTNAPVKMCYVDQSNPYDSYPVAEGETATSGFNKISGGQVGFGNTGWGVNYIAYLQVDASAIKGNVINATLSFEASGSTDSKRSTGWGVGYNNSVWSEDMTYDSADKSITTLGDVKWTSTKSATVFENFSFDITDAIKSAENGLATIIVYETAAAGGYIKNPTVEIQWTTESTYNVTFTETNGVEANVTVDDKDVTKGVSLANGTYTFTATAAGYQDYTGEFTVDGADLNVEFTMSPKATWNYTVKNNVNDAVKTGTCLEGLSVTVPYNKYILKDGTVWTKDAINKEYNYTFTPDADNFEAILEYAETETTDGIYFVEGEDIEGMAEVTRDNANIRCSNAAGGYAAEAVEVYTLKPGTYKVRMGVFGNKGATFILKAGEETILEAETQGYWYESVTEEAFTVSEETVLTFEGSASNKPLDYILITGTVDTETAVEAVEAAGAEGKWYNLQGVQVAAPTQPGLYINNGKKVIVK